MSNIIGISIMFKVLLNYKHSVRRSRTLNKGYQELLLLFIYLFCDMDSDYENYFREI